MMRILLFLLCALVARGELIPDNRKINWTPGTHTGVIGGIPTDRANFYNVTEAPYFADNTGDLDARPAIQQAIDDAWLDPECEGVYCPAGTYRLEGTLYFNHGFNNRTFKGDGSGQTIFMDYYGAPFSIGNGGTSDFSMSFADRTITAGLTKDSTTITIAGSTADLPVGRCIIIQHENDDTYPNFNVGGANVWTEQSGVTQGVQIVSKTSNTFTFFPPIYATRTGTAIFRGLSFQIESAGFEGFTVDCTNTTTLRALHVSNCWGSWIKDVEVTQANNYAIVMENCVQSEVRQVFIRDGKTAGSNRAGLLCGMWSCLVVDSIFVQADPNWEVNASSGNAFLYNYTGTTSATNNNHGPFNRFNLYEGNAIGFMVSDGYFGGAGPEVHFRNYYHHPEYAGINLRRGCRDFALVGNIVNIGPLGIDGYPNIGNTNFSGTAQLSMADPWKDFGMTGSLTARASDGAGEITLNSGDLYYDAGTVHNFTIYWGSPNPDNALNCTVTAYDDGTKVAAFTTAGVLPALSTDFVIGPGSFYPGDPERGTYEEQDLDVAATTIDKGNYIVSLDTFSPLGGDTLPASLVYDEAPDWWPEGFAWPPFNPASPSGVSVEMIPAAYRYFNDEPPIETGSGTINATDATIGTGTIGSRVSWSAVVSANRPGRHASRSRSRRARTGGRVHA